MQIPMFESAERLFILVVGGRTIRKLKSSSCKTPYSLSETYQSCARTFASISNWTSGARTCRVINGNNDGNNNKATLRSSASSVMDRRERFTSACSDRTIDGAISTKSASGWTEIVTGGKERISYLKKPEIPFLQGYWLPVVGMVRELRGERLLFSLQSLTHSQWRKEFYRARFSKSPGHIGHQSYDRRSDVNVKSVKIELENIFSLASIHDLLTVTFISLLVINKFSPMLVRLSTCIIWLWIRYAKSWIKDLISYLLSIFRWCSVHSKIVDASNRHGRTIFLK